MKKCIIILFVLFLFVEESHGQNSIDSTIITEGKSSISITPDKVSFRIELDELDLDRRKSIEKAFQIINKVKFSLNEIGVKEEELKTNRFNVIRVEEFNRSTNIKEFKGYRTDIELLMQLNYSSNKIDYVFDIFIDYFDDTFNIRFELSDELIEKSKEKLIQLAIDDSRNKAEIICKNTGVKLGNIAKAQYGEPIPIRYFGQPESELLLRGVMNDGIASSASSIESMTPKEIEISADIAIWWNFN